MAKVLVKNGADVNAAFNNETTPILMATMFGNNHSYFTSKLKATYY